LDQGYELKAASLLGCSAEGNKLRSRRLSLTVARAYQVKSWRTVLLERRSVLAAIAAAITALVMKADAAEEKSITVGRAGRRVRVEGH
jgi:hypothetical protein